MTNKNGGSTYASRAKQWFVNNKLHREDGPAIEHADGSKRWFINGLLHREDGPAVENANGTNEWYINGKQLTQAEVDIYKMKQWLETLI